MVQGFDQISDDARRCRSEGLLVQGLEVRIDSLRSYKARVLEELGPLGMFLSLPNNETNNILFGSRWNWKWRHFLVTGCV